MRWSKGMRGYGVARALALLVGLAAAPPTASALDVVVTIKPLHALVASVMGEAGVPHLLVKGRFSAHTYVPTPSDVTRLNEADVFFRMSETMEPFTERMVRSLSGPVEVVTLQDTPNLVLLERRRGATFDEAGTSEDGDHGHGGHAHGMIDGHAWLDPRNAKLMVDRIGEALSAKDPEQAAIFRANAAQLKARLDGLGVELARELAPVAGKPFIVFHDALHYFERRFGLRAAGSIAVDPMVPPSARRLSALRRQITAQGVACVLAEQQFDSRLVEAVAEGTPARVGTIDPEGSRIDPGPELYAALLRNLARDLKGCLAP